MVFINVKKTPTIFVFLILISTTFCYGAVFDPLYLHSLKTKQSSQNIRFLSHDGLYTYFQKHSGELSLSKNFSTQLVFKDPEHTQYTMNSSASRKRIIIEKDKSFYSHMNLKKDFELFVIEYGDINAQLIGRGRGGKLHLDDSWISYFSFQDKTLRFQELDGDKRSYSVMLDAPAESFFQVEVEMIRDDFFIYTDQNEDFKSQVIAFYPQTKQKSLVYLSSIKGTQQHLCKIENNLIISEFSKYDIKSGTTILSVNFKDSPSLKNIKTIYNFKSNDLPQTLCLENKFYFLKTRQGKKVQPIPYFDVYSIDIDNSKLSQHTQNKNIDQLLNLDGKLMVVLAGDYFQLTNQVPKTSKKIKKEGFK